MTRGGVAAGGRAGLLGLGPVPYHDFGVSRALSWAGIRTVDGADWWRAGATAVLAQQRPDGSWYAGPADAPDVLETCWRLLFLSRATVP